MPNQSQSDAPSAEQRLYSALLDLVLVVADEENAMFEGKRLNAAFIKASDVLKEMEPFARSTSAADTMDYAEGPGPALCNDILGKPGHYKGDGTEFSRKSPQSERAAKAYADKNPLGGPAVMFEAMAERIRAGEDYYAVLADYSLAHVPNGGSAKEVHDIPKFLRRGDD